MTGDRYCPACMKGNHRKSTQCWNCKGELAPVPCSPFFDQCPSCASKNVHHWEKRTDGEWHGGKDCRDCGVMSRRWIGKGNGRGLWTRGPGINEKMTVAEVTAILDAANAELTGGSASRPVTCSETKL